MAAINIAGKKSFYFVDMMLLENREGQRGGTDSKTDGRIEKDREGGQTVRQTDE